MARTERLTLAAFATASLLLRAVAFFHYRFDSDEPQHLHVAWGWTAGLVQYRDYFDNHAPLFHLLSAPLLALLGERADILLWMRAPMLLLFGFVLYGTFVIARRLYDTRVAWWAVVVLSLFPPFFLKSLEYRTDNLWNALWVGAVVVLGGTQPLTWRRGAAPVLSREAGEGVGVGPRRGFILGLILGTALTVSMKTTLLVITLGGAALIVNRGRVRNLRACALFAAGFVIVPAIVLAVFASLGALDEMAYCVVKFNELVGLTRPYAWITRALYPFMLAGVVFLAHRFRTAHRERYFLAVACGIFTVTILGFWILISPRDFLPLMPLLAMFVAAHLPQLSRVALLIVFIVSIWYYADKFENRTDEFITQQNQLLRLTRPGEPVMDIKGETIYRPRPFYYIFEAITRAQMARGRIADTVPEAVIRTRCHVAQADGPMLPPRGREFLSHNFVDLGRLRASGQWIHQDGHFTIAVPGRYVVVDENGQATGVLDGTAYNGARELAPGEHHFLRTTPDPVVVLWAPAFERGFSPFHLQDREF